MIQGIAIVLLGSTLTACAIVEGYQKGKAEAAATALKQRSEAQAHECEIKFPPGRPKIALARAQCLMDAANIVRPIMPFPDLLDAMTTHFVSISEQVQEGRMTVAQANEAIAAKRAELTAEEQRRLLANRSVAAQEGVAAASLQAVGPKTCVGGAQVVTCF